MGTRVVDTVRAINLFPLKSARAALVRGAPIAVAPVGPTGFEIDGVRDRDYVIVDTEANCMVTQRGFGANGEKVRHPGDRNLATLQVSIEADHLELSAPGHGSVDVATSDHDGKLMRVDIFGELLPARDAGPEVAAYLTRLLGRPITLARADRSRTRGLPPELQRPGASNDVAGADAAPFMMVSLASLAAQHVREGIAPGTIPVERFRASIVIDGEALGAFGEDRVAELTVGDMRAYLVDACARCTVINVDQQSGSYRGAALRLLRGRAGTSAATGSSGVFFGVDLNHIYSPGQLVRVGDPVSIDGWSDVPNVSLRAG